MTTPKLRLVPLHEEPDEDAGEGLTFDLDWTNAAPDRIRPFRLHKDEDQKWGTVRFTIPLRLWERVKKVCSAAYDKGLPYEGPDDLARDAFYKWACFLSDTLLSSDVPLLNAIQAAHSLDKLGREAADRKRIEDSWQAQEYDLNAKLASKSYPALLSTLSLITAYIRRLEPDYWWYSRWRHRIANSQVLRRSVAALQQNGYGDREVVLVLAEWINELKEEP